MNSPSYRCSRPAAIGLLDEVAARAAPGASRSRGAGSTTAAPTATMPTPMPRAISPRLPGVTGRIEAHRHRRPCARTGRSRPGCRRGADLRRRLRRGDERLDDPQVRDRIGRWHRRGPPLEHGGGEGVRLDRVGVRDVEGDRLGERGDRRIAAGGDEDARRAVRRDVERDLDRDPPGRAVDVDALVVLGARRAGEAREAGPEAEDPARDDVGARRADRARSRPPPGRARRRTASATG